MLALALVASFAHAPFPAASSAAIPNLASAADLAWANSLISLGRSIRTTAGPALGGLLVALAGGPFVFALNAASLPASALLISLAHGDYSGVPAPQEGATKGLSAGLRHVLASPILLPILAGSTIMWFAMNVAIPADAPLAQHFGAGSVASRRDRTLCIAATASA